MATSHVSRLAPANARDGVDTRKKDNWASIAMQTRKTICRSDTIIGLGNPAVTNWGDMMTGVYTQSIQPISRAERSVVALYCDMADEPWKYSDHDMFAWLELDTVLRAGPERAVVEAYWQNRDVLQQAEQARADKHYRAEKDALRKRFRPIANEVAVKAMKRWIRHDVRAIVNRFKGSAIKIQALVRGYQARCKTPQLDCCMCLSHRISTHTTEVGYMCGDCAAMGPYEDVVEGDPWNWYRC